MWKIEYNLYNLEDWATNTFITEISMWSVDLFFKVPDKRVVLNTNKSVIINLIFAAEVVGFTIYSYKI